MDMICALAVSIHLMGSCFSEVPGTSHRMSGRGTDRHGIADLLSEGLIRRLNSTDFWCNIG